MSMPMLIFMSSTLTALSSAGIFGLALSLVNAMGRGSKGILGFSKLP